MQETIAENNNGIFSPSIPIICNFISNVNNLYSYKSFNRVPSALFQSTFPFDV